MSSCICGYFHCISLYISSLDIHICIDIVHITLRPPLYSTRFYAFKLIMARTMRVNPAQSFFQLMSFLTMMGEYALIL